MCSHVRVVFTILRQSAQLNSTLFVAVSRILRCPKPSICFSKHSLTVMLPGFNRSLCSYARYCTATYKYRNNIGYSINLFSSMCSYDKYFISSKLLKLPMNFIKYCLNLKVVRSIFLIVNIKNETLNYSYTKINRVKPKFFFILFDIFLFQQRINGCHR